MRRTNQISTDGNNIVICDLNPIFCILYYHPWWIVWRPITSAKTIEQNLHLIEINGDFLSTLYKMNCEWNFSVRSIYRSVSIFRIIFHITEKKCRIKLSLRFTFASRWHVFITRQCGTYKKTVLQLFWHACTFCYRMSKPFAGSTEMKMVGCASDNYSIFHLTYPGKLSILTLTLDLYIYFQGF